MMHAEPSRVVPVVFSSDMVRALIAGRKTVTRRLATSPLARCERGDLLWVREQVEISERGRASGEVVFTYVADGRVSSIPWPSRLKRPSPGARTPRFMPRELSRLTLRVLSVRQERLRWLDDHEAWREGVDPDVVEGEGLSARGAFAALWDRLHPNEGERWEDNPEVVAVYFGVISRPVDALLPGLGRGGVR